MSEKDYRDRWYDSVPWFGLTITVVIVALLGFLVWMVIQDTVGYARQCHNAGGHIVTVRGSDICVDRDTKVIFL